MKVKPRRLKGIQYVSISRSLVIGIAPCVLSLITHSPCAGDDAKPGIVWECGQNVPDSAYWTTHGAELERMLPFDGVMFKMEHPVTEGGTMQIRGDRRIANKVLTSQRITEQMTAPFVEDVRAAQLKKNHHMVHVWLGSAGRYLRYGDDALWEIIQNNIRLVASAARDAGFAGIVFDPEQYGGDRCWNYTTNSSATGVDMPYADFAQLVRRRGKQFGHALSAGYPDCLLLFFIGHSMTTEQLKARMAEGQKATLQTLGDLYVPFLDGMLEGTSDGTVFVDGMEHSYSFATAEAFRQGRWTALVESRALTSVPDLFDKKVRCGFGIWTDNRYDGFGWYPYDVEQNRFSPARLQRSIHLALKYSDGYVWLWNERANWYVDGPDGTPHPPCTQQPQSSGVDRRYRKAVAEAKAWPGLDTRPPRSDQFADHRTMGYLYEDELDHLLTQAEPVMDLPAEGWLFKPDLKYIGADEKWYLPRTPTNDWKPIRIGEFWERQGFGYLDGPGWYRRQIGFNNLPEAKRLYLSFGAVDESCHLWIDGRYVAVYDRGVPGWDKPFAIEVTGFIKSGTHTLVIRAHDNRRMGGIWKPVSLIAR